MLNGVIFDFNGTLFFDSQYHLEVFDQLSMEIAGRHLTMQEMEEQYAGKPNTEIFRMMSDGRFTREQCEAYSIRKEKMYRDLVRRTPGGPHLCNGAEELFDLLKKNQIPFTIASASIKKNIDFFIEIFHLDQWIKPENIVYDNGSYRDKKDMFRDAMKKIGVSDHVLVFEDSLSGIQCASVLRASLIVIDRNSLRPYYHQYPEILHKVRDMKEAIPYVKEMIEE